MSPYSQKQDLKNK